MQIQPDIERLPQVIEQVDAFLDTTACGMKARIALQTAAEEAFVNICRYSGATEATLELTLEGDAVRLRFTDDGAAFDPFARQAPDTTLSAQERPIGGLGILMIARMTDRQSYAREGSRNVLTLWKSIA